MDFRTQLLKQIRDEETALIIEELGFTHVKNTHIKRLEEVIDSPYLGLERCHFDFKYSSEEYLLKLAEICGIDKQLACAYIKDTQKFLQDKREAFKPYIFIDTGFKRTTQPIFALAACESRRYIKLPADFYLWNDENKLHAVLEAVKEHSLETGGDTGIWGMAIAYFYVFADKRALEISPTGKVGMIHENYYPSNMATIRIA